MMFGHSNSCYNHFPLSKLYVSLCIWTSRFKMSYNHMNKYSKDGNCCWKTISSWSCILWGLFFWRVFRRLQCFWQDVSSVFDTVDNQIRLQSISLWCAWVCYKVIQRLLPNRQQCVFYNSLNVKHLAGQFNIIYGFLHIKHDLVSLPECTFSMLFANDNHLCISRRGTSLIMRTLNNELN